MIYCWFRPISLILKILKSLQLNPFPNIVLQIGQWFKCFPVFSSVFYHKQTQLRQKRISFYNLKIEYDADWILSLLFNSIYIFWSWKLSLRQPQTVHNTNFQGPSSLNIIYLSYPELDNKQVFLMKMSMK